MRERKWTIMAGRKSTKTAAKTTETVKVEAIEPKEEEIKAEEIAEPAAAPAKKAPAKRTRSAKKEAPQEASGAEAAAADTAKAAKKETAKAPAKTIAKKAAAKKPEDNFVLHIQYGGRSYAQEELLKIAKDVWKYDLKRKAGELESIELYVKPEENKVYYVMNGEVTGNFDI